MPAIGIKKIDPLKKKGIIPPKSEGIMPSFLSNKYFEEEDK